MSIIYIDDSEYIKGDQILMDIYVKKEKTPEQIQNEKDMEELFGYKGPIKYNWCE